MRRKAVWVHLFILAMLAVPIVAQTLAETSRYNKPTEKAIAGVIAAVVSFPNADGSVGVHFDLTTETGLVSVHLAPAAYIGQHNFWFVVDDKVSIIGSRVSDDGNVAIWAKAIQKGTELLVLRSDDGTPKWTPASDGVDGCGVNHAGLPRGTER